MTFSLEPQILKRPDGTRIAYHYSPPMDAKGKAATVMFCGGLMSDMTGTKATALEDHCRSEGYAYVRFDYRGHGQSDHKFEDTVISEWADDAIAVLDEVTNGPVVVVGSSMGGWIMLLLTLARPDRVKALIGIAPAPDFTPRMWEGFDAAAKLEMTETGYYRRPSEYSEEPYVISKALIDDGNKNLVLNGPVPITCPVRILHGMLDPDVPWQHSLEIAEKLDSDDVVITYVKSGDHRLSEPDDIARLLATVDDLV